MHIIQMLDRDKMKYKILYRGIKFLNEKETKENWNDQYITCTLLGLRFTMPLLVGYKIYRDCA